MANALLIGAGIILACILANRFSNRFGLPALLLFMAVGMLFGSDGIFKISFDNYYLTEQVCTVALIFIMFYGGFCTKWDIAKPVAAKATFLASVGVVVTALLVCVFCYFVLGFEPIESFLIGAVISSTDAASVFSILRSKKLSLKDGTASMLELESGSNDPTAYMLTMIGLTLLKGNDMNTIWYMLFAQIVYGVVLGVVIAIISIFILQKLNIVPEGLDTIFIIAVMLISFALTNLVGGNGFLSVYLTGIILGNSKIKNKVPLIHFFDALTGLAQIVIFFLLGLLAFPHRIIDILPATILITLFLTFIARPIAVFGILLPAKCSIRQCLLVSWAGLRGAASIVFAIMVIAVDGTMQNDLFHIVFLIALLSVTFQGTLLPFIAKKLHMVDEETDVRKTFNDYQEESAMTLMRLFIPPGHSWINRTMSKVNLPTGSLALMIKRNGETIVPRGDTLILENDAIILSVPSYQAVGEANLKEIKIDNGHEWQDKAIQMLNLPQKSLVAMIKRGEQNIIPRGKTVIKENDVVVIYKE